MGNVGKLSKDFCISAYQTNASILHGKPEVPSSVQGLETEENKCGRCAGAPATAQGLIASLTPEELAAFPTVPQGLQIILLPANLSLPGLPAASAIPASFTVPQQLQSYDYILTSASDAILALPAGYNASSPTDGKKWWRDDLCV